MYQLDYVESLPYGAALPVGGYQSTILADFDFETFSMAGFVWNDDRQKWGPLPGVAAQGKGLSSVGVVNYSEHPSFEVLSLYYDLKDGQGRRHWRPGLANPQDLFDHLAAGRLLEAWNVGFEKRAWRRCVQLYGWPSLEPHISQLRCAMAKSRAHARPGALGKAAAVAGTLAKDAEGDKGIKLFCVPQNPTKKQPKTRLTAQDEPELFERLIVQYNETDIRSEAHNSANTPDLTPLELEYWQADQTINDRGVHVDLAALRGAERIINQAIAKYGREFEQITGGIKPTELQQLRGWCSGLGVHLLNATEDTLAETLADPDLPALVRRALEIRALVGSASVKKVFAMINQASSDSRLHDLFIFQGARTGRPTGYGPQPTNLPKAGPNVWRCQCGKHFGHSRPACPWCGLAAPTQGQPAEWSPEAMYDAMAVVIIGNLELLELFFGEALLTVAGCLRGMFTAAPGKTLISSDYTAIEAVVLACLAGEQWRIDLFREGGKIYEKSGALVTGETYENILAHKVATGQHHPARQIGKTAELGLGYQGWVGAWRAFDENSALSDDDIKKIVLAWRAASPAIVEFWGGQSRRRAGGLDWELFGVEGHFIQSILTPDLWYEYRGLRFITRDGTTYIYLPSGRCLTYHNTQLRQSEKYGCRYAISYWGWNTNPKNGPSNQWINMDTWGGRLVENIGQAVGNDILRHATVKLEAANYPVVLHVYDEIVAEVPEGFGSVDELETIMRDLPPWAVLPDGSRWPIGAAGGWTGKRYRKG